MKEQKNIDRLFQEKFKDFEATPNDAVWNRINAQLHEKKDDRKRIPIWWKIAGIAAGLLLLVTIGYNALNSTADTQNNPTEFVDTENPSNTETKNVDDKNALQNDANENSINKNLVPYNTTIASENLDETTEQRENTNSNPLNVTPSKKKNYSTTEYKNNTVANSNTTTNQNPSNNAVTQTNNTPKTNSNNNATNQENTNAVANNNIPQNLPEQPTFKNEKQNTANAIVNSSEEKGIAAVTNIEEEEEEDIKATTADEKPSIEDAIASAEDEEDINEKEKDVIDRWSVTPNVAPVYYNTLGSKGSSIDSQFNSNTKTGDLNMSYGITAGYALSKKLSVRTGVSRVNVGYKTNEVIVYQNIGTVAANNDFLRNIKLDPAAQNTAIVSSESLAFAEVPEIVSQNFKASLNQDISFIEVPVELEYKLIDKKVDLNLIGGFSTMFLNDNAIYAEIFDEAVPVGEANNINDVSFSANFGIGLEVKLSKRINLNLEPTFKYQINTFNNTSGGFKPYIMGINSGLKFKF